MALSDIKTTESGKHDWLLLYFLILPIISNTQTHNDHQQRIQKLRSDNQTGLPKGQTVCLIQLDLVMGQGSSFTTQRIPIAQFFLSYREQIKDLHSSTRITACGREKMKCEFQPWVHMVFPVLPVNAALMKARNFSCSKYASQFPPKVQIQQIQLSWQSSTFLYFFIYGQIRVERTRMTMQHYGSDGSWWPPNKI